MKNTTVTIIVIVALIVGYGIGYAVGNKTAGETTNNTGMNPPNSAENAPPGSIHNLPLPSGVSAARTELARTLSIPESQILIETAFEKDWSDSCLGLGGPAESCLMAITPGYEVTMQAQGKTYVYRTDTTGMSVRKQSN